ncbi:MAG: NYN domain-containing protein [Thermodesulfobacteriota bacterium]
MGPHLIIDGYNLMMLGSPSGRERGAGLEEERRALLRRLMVYKRLKGWPVTVVFDAAGGPHLSEKTEQAGGVKVVYSPAGVTADQVIAAMARRLGPGSLVVTSDRALARTVEAAGAVAVGSPEFERRLRAALDLETKGPAEEDEDGALQRSTRKKGPGRRSSKSLRRRSARQDKL